MKDQRVAFVQYGDYLQAAERLAGGGEETYGAQRYSVELVEDLRSAVQDVLVVSQGPAPYDRPSPGGVQCVGITEPPNSREGSRLAWGRLADWKPTMVVVRFPGLGLISRCLKARWRVLPLLADSFRGGGLRARLDNYRLARLFNRREIELVANHQVTASRDLVRIGVDPAKVIPWDWPALARPEDSPARPGVSTPGRISVFFAGSLSETKGVGDLIRAIEVLHRQGIPARLTVAGKGETEAFRGEAARLGLADHVRFAGLVSNTEVIALMRSHDAVVVPSHHAYPEGLPMTIIEAWASRTPLVVSDHPMFLPRIEHERSALVFPERDADALAARLRRLVEEPDLYARLSEAAEGAWNRLRIPVDWGDLVLPWISGRPEDIRGLRQFSLSEFAYS